MKGIMFTELIEMMEACYSPELADRVLTNAELPDGGAYTAVARYPSEEWRRIVDCLSEATGTPVNELIRSFGEYLFGKFVVLYPELVTRFSDAYSLLESVEGFIHVEVRKLYPDAHLPEFRTTHHGPGTLVMEYRSPRPLADLCEGLIRGTLKHFAEDIEVSREDTPGGPPFHSVFTMRRRK
jgi:hypothetical protein